MPDGTIKQINPFSQTEVWCVEERGNRSIIEQEPPFLEKRFIRTPEDYCHFCESQYENTPPEKARLSIDTEGNWKKQYHLDPELRDQEFAEFRRMGNLFEIVTYDYWAKNYGFSLSHRNQAWMQSYLESASGYDHIMNILGIKLHRMGLDISELDEEALLYRATPFFGGSHELIISRHHYIPGSEHTHNLYSSGAMTEEQHYHYTRFTIESLQDISQDNPFIRYISVFQNWLRPAGASFDHLHKQLVGLDEWGVQIERELSNLVHNPNLYNELAANFALYNSLNIAENEYAIAFTEIGHRFPTIAIYSKSHHCQPFHHEPEEIRGMSDLIHAMHAALGNQTACNEEWFYTPFDAIYPSPWHVLIKLRIHTPAGFEGNTKIYINPVSPHRLRQVMVDRLQEIREAGHIHPRIRIGAEVVPRPNPLNYVHSRIIPQSRT